MQATQKQHYQIQGNRITFKPYCRKYVKEYHQWFEKDPELLYLTGSEPLSLEEEYSNHQSWIQDPSKYTFIIFNEQGRMIGDINLFFSEWIEPQQAQINIMIALKNERGKGYARQALKLIEAFALIYYKKTEILAKIKEDNVGSQKLFTTSGYEFYEKQERYQQIEYRKKLQDFEGSKQLLEGKVSEVKEVSQIMAE